MWPKIILLTQLIVAPIVAQQPPSRPKTLSVAAGSPSDYKLAEAVLAELEERGVSPSVLEKRAPVKLEGGPAGISHFLRENHADIFLILGVAAVAELTDPAFRIDKPIVAGFFHDPSLFGIAFDEAGRSGKTGLSLVLPGNRLARDLSFFHKLTHAKHMGVIMAEPLFRAFPKLGDTISKAGTGLGLRLLPIEAGPSPELVTAGIGSDVAAVYLGPLNHYSEKQRRSLYEKLNERGLPTYAMSGIEAVKAGVFAGALLTPEKRLVTRLADQIEAVTRGEPPENLPAYLPLRERLTVNGKTAAAIGFELGLEEFIQADVLFPEALARGEPLSLRDSVEHALAGNPSLRAQRQAEAAAGFERKAAIAAFLPQISADWQHVRNNDDNPQIATGLSPETQTTLSINAQQVIFDENTLADSRIARLSQEGIRSQANQLSYDITNHTAAAYLRLLVNRALLDIEIENLKLTRSNLETARARVRLGAAGNEELFRWESQAAQQLGSVYTAKAQVDSARASLGNLMGKTLPPGRYIGGSALNEEDTLFLSDRWVTLSADPSLPDPLVRLAIQRSPQVEGSRIQGRIAARRESQAKRRFFLPSISLNANINDALQQDFLDSGSGFPDFSLEQKDRNWQVSLKASIPIFNGGRRFQNLGQARADHRRALNLQSASELSIEERVRRTLAAVQASFPNIALAELAADRAQRHLQIVLSKYERGGASILDLLEAQEQDLTRGRRAAVAEYAHLANIFELQRALSFFDWNHTPSERDRWLQVLEAKLNTSPTPRDKAEEAPQ